MPGSGMFNKEARAAARKTSAADKPQMVTVSVRCWDRQRDFLQKASQITNVPVGDYLLEDALARASKDLNMPLPECPVINRRPVKGGTAVERVAKLQGMSVKEWEKKIAAEMAEKMLAGLSATGSEPRKVAGTTRRAG